MAKVDAFRPRDVASGVLHATLLGHLETFLARAVASPRHSGPPPHVEREELRIRSTPILRLDCATG
jgi:hypothetical protein